MREFLRSNIKPVEDRAYGKGYRASVYLKDGTYLPAVMFYNPTLRVDLALERFDQERYGESVFLPSKDFNPYRQIVQNFVTGGCHVAYYNIARIEKSPSAIPKSIMSKIEGETTMSWTGFVAQMRDENHFAFGSDFELRFFTMPEGYVAEDIEEILNHSYLNVNGEIKSHTVPFREWPSDYDESVVYRNRPYFDCYLEGL